jgi:signal transduction histidine kinase
VTEPSVTDGDLFAGTPGLLAWADAAGTLRRANPAWIAALGPATDAAAFGDLAHPDDRAAVAGALEDGGGGTHRFGERVLSWRAVRRGDALLIAAWDVTPLRAEADALGIELDVLVSSVSHDLRAPLRAIDGFAGVLLGDAERAVLPADTVRFLELLREASGELAARFDALLEVARAARDPLTPRDGVDVATLAREVVDYVLAPRQGDRAVDWVVGDVPPCRADPALLRRLLEALLDNALKFTAERARARIELAWDPAATAYVVRDDGIGFDPALAGTAFSIFGRLPTERPYPGAGVGLAVAVRIAARHGGRVWCEATPGAGAAFRFTIEA